MKLKDIIPIIDLKETVVFVSKAAIEIETFRKRSYSS